MCKAHLRARARERQKQSLVQTLARGVGPDPRLRVKRFLFYALHAHKNDTERPLTTMQSHMIENTGSTARDFCMLERNILSHLKLALLLSLLSSSLLLQVRLVPGQDKEKSKSSGIPLASVEFFAALAAVVGGVWEYYSGYWDLRKSRAFLVAVKCVCQSTSQVYVY